MHLNSLHKKLLNPLHHNAHHEKPAAPWYRLPAIHRELFGSEPAQIIPMAKLLSLFRRHRVKRVLAHDVAFPSIP